MATAYEPVRSQTGNAGTSSNGNLVPNNEHTIVHVEQPTAAKESPSLQKPQPKGITARTWLFVKLGFTALAALFVAIAIYLSVTNSQSNAVKRSTDGSVIMRYDSTNTTADVNGVELGIKMTSFDPSTGLLKLSINLNPAPLIASPNFGGSSLGTNRTVTLSINDKTVTFVGNNNALLTPSQEVSVNLIDSSAILNSSTTNFAAQRDDPVNYPIDRYEKAVVLSASISDTSANRSSAPFVINVYLYGVVPGYAVSTSIPGDLSIVSEFVNTAWFDVTITRANTVIVFSIFVGALMWIVSLSLASICISLWFLGSKPEPPILAASVALLFALPAFRNVQPGAPPVGSSSDLASFYWAVAIAALCAFSTLLHFFKTYKGDKLVAPKKAN
ncbi:hypothetical protein BJ742DRAFT_142186 [Cladochytrium replicatum]|nr:hypothetical protein BJ742DRAFT_142186 [Cladochytrium replicatum]